MDTGERSFLGCSQDVFSPHGNEDFCTRDNWQTAVLYLAQEMEVFGPASPCTKPESGVTLEASAGGQGSGQPRRDHPGQLQLEADPDVQTGPETTRGV